MREEGSHIKNEGSHIKNVFEQIWHKIILNRCNKTKIINGSVAVSVFFI